MPFFSDTDLDGFMNTFGEDVVISGETVQGIYRATYAEVADAASRIREVLVLTSDVPNIAEEQSVYIASDSYSGSVGTIMDDGLGVLTLRLVDSG